MHNFFFQNKMNHYIQNQKIPLKPHKKQQTKKKTSEQKKKNKHNGDSSNISCLTQASDYYQSTIRLQTIRLQLTSLISIDITTMKRIFAPRRFLKIYIRPCLCLKLPRIYTYYSPFVSDQLVFIQCSISMYNGRLSHTHLLYL